MSDFDSAIRNLAKRNLRGIKIDASGPVETGGFIRVGVTLNRDAANKMFAEMGYLTLKAKYDILRRLVHHLAWLSPVYTGYYVNSWQASNSARKSTTHVSQEPNPVGAYISSGSMRRKLKKSDSEADSLRMQSEQRMVDALQSVFLAYEGTNVSVLKDTWAFYNPVPYASKVKVKGKHDVIKQALVNVSSGA